MAFQRALETAGFGLLAPAPLVFALRSAVALAGREAEAVPGLAEATGAAGVLSLLGLLAVVLANWHRGGPMVPWIALFLVLLGHFLLAPVADDLGAAFVYTATGIVGTLRDRRVLFAGVVAASGALLRGVHAPTGHAVLVVGGLALGALLAWAAFRRPAPESV